MIQQLFDCSTFSLALDNISIVFDPCKLADKFSIVISPSKDYLQFVPFKYI